MTKKTNQKFTLITTVCILFLFTWTPGIMAQVMKLRQPSAEVQILYFGKYIPPGTMLATTGRSTHPDIPVYRINAGESFTFSWTFKTKNATQVFASLIGEGRTTTLNPGTPTDTSDGWKLYKNRRGLIIRNSGEYTLRVSVMPSGSNSLKEKTIRFEVSRPSLEVVMPTVNPTSRRVTFKVRNRGTSTASGRFRVTYKIHGRNPRQYLIESQFTTDPMDLGRNRILELGYITLPESAWQSAQLWMRVTINLIGRISMSAGPTDFTYSWPTHTLTVNSAALSLIGSAMTGHILVHNYTNPSGDTTKHRPYQENASSIELMDIPYTFTFSYIVFRIVGVEYFFFVRNFRANLGGRNFLTINNGKLCLNVSFNCSASREVKGWVRNYVRKRYEDNGCPDVDIQRFNLKLFLIPILKGNKISYRNPSLSIDSRMRFPGGWSWLNGFKDKMNREVKRTVKIQFERMLNSNSIKTLLEDRLTQVVMDLGSRLGIHDLVSVRGRGDEIIITYR